MAYKRVIPRDLFNEANLLKCLGRVWILLESRPKSRAKLSEGDGSPFQIIQDEGDGSLSVANLPFTSAGRRFRLFRPLNSREAWPLYAIAEGDRDAEEVEVFETFDGDAFFTQDFLTLIGEYDDAEEA